MPHIPKVVLEQQPLLEGLPLRGRGKVRDTYLLPDHSNHLLVVASDRISIFDFVLPILVEKKGVILNALNHFQTTTVLGDLFKTDLVACGGGVDEFLPKNLRGNIELQKRASVVTLLDSPEVEDIVRFNLTGSGWKSYQKDRTVGGFKLPEGLIDGSELPFPIYTPSTKAKVGHDLPLTADEVVEKYGYKRERLALHAMQTMRYFARTRGLLILDGKLEIFDDILIDEKGTLDACRYVDAKKYDECMARGKLPPSLDKQYVREVGIQMGINKLDPENPEHLALVEAMVFPREVIDNTIEIYYRTFERLTNSSLVVYQREQLGINIY